MTTDVKENIIIPTTPTVSAPASSGAPAFSARPQNDRGPRRGGFDQRKNPRKPGREERAKPEYDQKILTIRRVTRVAAGGRRFSFSVAIVIGNRKGSVGVGTGKAGDTSLAIDKAVKNARKNLLKIPLTKSMSIPHEVYVKYSSARVLMRPAPAQGLVSGSAVRDVLDLGGVKDVVTKIFSGSKNKLNIARAAVKALSELSLVRNSVKNRANIAEKAKQAKA